MSSNTNTHRSNPAASERTGSFTQWILPVACSVAVFAFAFQSFAGRRTSLQCRCTSDQPCWPSAADFEALASEISQPLLYPVPPASPCYLTDQPSDDCSIVLSSWRNGNWRADQPGAMQAPHTETFIYIDGSIEACYLNSTLGVPCKQGNVPAIGVDARSPEDIVAAIKFVTKHNLRLVVKNTGHDYIGRSTAKGSFMIWTHHLKKITFDEKFNVANSSVVVDNTLTLQSGVQFGEAYAAASRHNRVFVGGVSQDGSVGAAAGWVSGGGHSLLSPSYGLAVDNVVQIAIVTADGRHLITNEYSNPDLFWALRGGGGGTWGVVTSVTYRTHPDTTYSHVFFQVRVDNPNNANPNATQNLLSELIRMTPTLNSLGFGCQGIIIRSLLYLSFLSPKATWEQTNDMFHPLFEYAADQAKTGGLIVKNFTASYTSFQEVFDVIIEQMVDVGGASVGSTLQTSSWIFPSNFAQGDTDHIASVLLDLPNTLLLLQGGAVNTVDPDAMGVVPAWRNSSAYVAINGGWKDGASSAEIEAVHSNFKLAMAKLQSLAPGSGSYLNQASLHEFDFKTSFFGSHYDMLKKIKDKYDPDAFFVVYQGVGSDEWDANLNCRIK